jgi:hypothetical protein
VSAEAVVFCRLVIIGLLADPAGEAQTWNFTPDGCGRNVKALWRIEIDPHPSFCTQMTTWLICSVRADFWPPVLEPGVIRPALAWSPSPLFHGDVQTGCAGIKIAVQFLGSSGCRCRR